MLNTVPERPSWLPQEKFPFESRFLELGGRRIHYVDEGTGPTLLFVHAGPAWSFIFRDVIVRLRDQHRCIALDFPRSGLSPFAADHRSTLKSSAQLLESFVQELDLRDITLVAHDLGGPVALHVAASLRDRFRAMVMTESFGWPLTEQHPKTARTIRIVSGPVFGLLNDVTNVLTRLTATSYGIGRHLAASGKRAFRGPYRDRRVRRAALSMLGDALAAGVFLREVDLALRTRLADMPMLFVFGEKSPQMREGFREAWMARFPEAHVFVVPGGHHFPMMDDPNALASAIHAWSQERDEARPPTSTSHLPTATSAG